MWLLHWAPSNGPILGIYSVRNALLHCLAHFYFCSINSLHSIHSRKPTLTSTPVSLLNKSELDPPRPHSSRTAYSIFPPFIPLPPAYHSADHTLLLLSSYYLSVPFLNYEFLRMEHKCLYTTSLCLSAWLVLNKCLMVNTE